MQFFKLFCAVRNILRPAGIIIITSQVRAVDREPVIQEEGDFHRSQIAMGCVLIAHMSRLCARTINNIVIYLLPATRERRPP